MHAAFDEMGANMSGQRWTYQETKMAFALYCLIPTTEIDKKNADVWRLAEGLQRTPRSVAMKLWNIAALDDRRVSQGKWGLSTEVFLIHKYGTSIERGETTLSGKESGSSDHCWTTKASRPTSELPPIVYEKAGIGSSQQSSG